MSLTLIEESEWFHRYKLSDGREVKIQLDDSLEWIMVTDSEGEEIGRIEFSQIENKSPLDDEYKITWMYMDIADASYKRIGRACLKLFKECGFGPPTVSDDHGMKNDDGSHLTQDAPAFVHKMQEEGLIAKNPNSF